MPLKKVVTWRDTPLTRGEQLTLMFNILFMRTASAAGTAFREASFSWRCGHFLLSHYPFFVLFHSRLRVLHVHWQCGLLARPLNSSGFSISLLIVSYFLLITFLFLCFSSCSRFSSAELPSNISPMIIINHVTLPRSRRRASHGAAATSSFHINLSSFVNSRVSFLSARTTCSLATRSVGPAFQFFSQSFPHFSLFFSVSFKLLLSINLGDYDSRILACNLQQRSH